MPKTTQRRKDITEKAAWHQSSVISKRQQARIAQGKVESKPSDYKGVVSYDPKLIALRDARHRLEDMKMQQEYDL